MFSIILCGIYVPEIQPDQATAVANSRGRLSVFFLRATHIGLTNANVFSETFRGNFF